MDNERLKRLFPSYFDRFELPDGAHEESITVYRACKTQACDKESFTPSFEEQGLVYMAGDNPENPGLYSLSTFEKPKDVKRFVNMQSEYQKPYKIAVGNTEPKYGLVQRTKERTGRKTSHVDWWLYQGAKPYEVFQIIDDFETYFEEYKQNKG
ncbi:MAG: hypothetical protein PUB10_08680 [Clostridiales bacterium]|nr:hypothetical protein [Clostridiales bacterium]